MPANIKVYVESDYDSASKRAAELFAEKVRENPRGAFGFATGSTPLGMYRELGKMSLAGRLDMTQITAFNLDEYHPIKPGDTHSYAYYMAKNLFEPTGVKNRNIPSGDCDNPAEECQHYDRKLDGCGGIKLQILGIGQNGHIGFNEPGGVFSRGTCHVKLAAATIAANAKHFGNPADIPRSAITMGIGHIMLAEELLLVAAGEAKAAILRDALTGLVTPIVPASILQFHRKVTVVADREAGRLIK